MDEHSTTRVLVIRHGETIWNTLGRQQGHLDTALSARGIAQAERLAAALVDRKIDHLFSSDLGRARQTAQIIAAALHMEDRCEPRLRERHLGILQGLTIEEFRLQHPTEHSHFISGDMDWVIPGGESVHQRHQRVVDCAIALATRYPGKTIALVTHGSVLDSFFRHACGLSLGAPRTFSLLNASLNEFSVTAERWKLEHWGDIHHLRDLDADDDW